MTPEQGRDRVAALLPEAGARVEHGRVVADVPRAQWVPAVTALRDDAALAAACFDLLTAVDDGAAGLQVVLSLWSVAERVSVLLRTRCPADDPHVPSLAAVFPGAGWHERHAAEMFGLTFDGHPSPGPLLLPDGFDGAPLRKDFVLATRAVTPWPGTTEPGAGQRRSRRTAAPPGVPRPGTWGPS